MVGGDYDRLRSDARELAGLRAGRDLAITTPAVAALKQDAPAIPVVFVAVSDPVGGGFVDSLPRPGGNITGFIDLEGSLSGKWLELLKEVVPGLTHAAIHLQSGATPFAGILFARVRGCGACRGGGRRWRCRFTSADDIER